MDDVDPLNTLLEYYKSEITATYGEIFMWRTLDPVMIVGSPESGDFDYDNTVVTSVGLFGYDLTPFLDDCATLEEML
jgi:hypothetical protein